MRTVNATTELPLLAARLKAAGAGGIKLQMVRALRAAAKPVVDDLKVAAAADLPKRGGLNMKVAGQPIKVSVRTTGASAGVSVRAQYTKTNKGSWRHPVFGNTNVWVTQTYGPAKGWFDKTAEKGAPAAQVEMAAVLELVAIGVNARGF